MGLVFGSVRFHVDVTMADNDAPQTTERFYYVIDHFKFKDRAEITKAFSQTLSHERGASKLIGWFKMRGNSPPQPSIREESLHYQFEKIWVKPGRAPPPLLFGLFVSSMNSAGSMFTCGKKFFLMIKGECEFIPVTLEIKNLSSGSAAEYKDLAAIHSIRSKAQSLGNLPPRLDQQISTQYVNLSENNLISAFKINNEYIDCDTKSKTSTLDLDRKRKRMTDILQFLTEENQKRGRKCSHVNLEKAEMECL